MPEHKTIIEVNGVKLEVDLRHAKRVDELRVGDRVKVLKKGYSDYAVYAGTVIGFEPFKQLPTIIVAYVRTGYADFGVEFVHFNAQSKDVEIVKAVDDDSIDIEKAHVIAQLDSAIMKKMEEAEELRRKKAYFLDHFHAYWEPVETAEKAAE